MPKTLSKAIASRLIRSAGLRRSLSELHLLSGMDAVYLDELGNERLSVPRQSGLAFRRLLFRDPETRALAVRARQAALNSSGDAEVGSMLEIAHPIRIEGEQVGYLLLSGARREDQGVDASREVWILLAKGGGRLSWGEWADAWLAMPVLTGDQIQAWRNCLRLYADETLRGEETGRRMLPDKQSLSPLVLRCCQWVQERIGEPVLLSEAAAACGVSSEHLSRRFHAETGLRFREYLMESRVGAACAALAETEDLISDIAGRCGFSTLSRFNRGFREVLGMTPREWRKRSRMRARVRDPRLPPQMAPSADR